MIVRQPKIGGCTFREDLVEKPGLLFLRGEEKSEPQIWADLSDQADWEPSKP